MSGILIKLNGLVRRLRGDRRGVGAVEFALVAPVLIVLYVGSLEISVAMSVNKKIARAASTIADIVTQETDVNKAFLTTMADVAESVITPFNTTGMKIRISGIKIDALGVAKVAWSWDESNGRPYAAGSETTIPAQLTVGNSFLVRTEVQMDYSLLLVVPSAQDIDINNLTMKKTYHLRQRIGDQIACSDC